MVQVLLRQSFPNALYLDLEFTHDLNRLQNAELYLSQRQDRLVVLDEILTYAELFSLLRSLIDRQRRAGDLGNIPLLVCSLQAVWHHLASLKVLNTASG